MYHHVFLKDGIVKFDFVLCLFSLTDLCESIIAELAERSSIIIQNGSSNSNPSSRKRPRNFILVNFTDVNQRDILNMSNKELEMWISSDEIDVSAEEDVFKIILA